MINILARPLHGFGDDGVGAPGHDQDTRVVTERIDHLTNASHLRRVLRLVCTLRMSN